MEGEERQGQYEQQSPSSEAYVDHLENTFSQTGVIHALQYGLHHFLTDPKTIQHISAALRLSFQLMEAKRKRGQHGHESNQ